MLSSYPRYAGTPIILNSDGRKMLVNSTTTGPTNTITRNNQSASADSPKQADRRMKLQDIAKESETYDSKDKDDINRTIYPISIHFVKKPTNGMDIPECQCRHRKTEYRPAGEKRWRSEVGKRPLNHTAPHGLTLHAEMPSNSNEHRTGQFRLSIIRRWPTPCRLDADTRSMVPRQRMR